jgi:hypothetical protein
VSGSGAADLLKPAKGLHFIKEWDCVDLSFMYGGLEF